MQNQMRSPRSLILGGLACVLIGVLAGWQWQAAHPDRAAMEQVVHDYLIAHPEVLPEAMEALRRQDAARALAGIRPVVETPFPGAVLGNPVGKRVLVEYTDYACGYCRKSVADVDALIAGHPDLKVVIRQLPILTPESADAAKMALAAAEQGKFAAFHKALFAIGRPDRAGVRAAAAAAGLDMARATRVAADPQIATEIARNLEIARQLGFNGTPSWVAGDAVLSGAVGEAELAKAIGEKKG